MAIQVNGLMPYLNMFEINGITLDSTREGLTVALGNPVEYGEHHMIYHISSPNVNYTLILEFEDKTEISGIRISRAHGQ